MTMKKGIAILGVSVLVTAAGEASALPLPDSSSCNSQSPCLYIQQQNSINDGIYGSAIGGPGLRGASSSAEGVHGTSLATYGVYGEARTTGFAYGVYGYSVFGSGPGVYGKSDKGDGVEGRSNTSGRSGVYAHNDSGTGYGVYGAASGTGQGVHGENGNSSGWAGYFNGKVFTTASYQSSDLRLKKDIKETPYGLEHVLELHPVTFKWKNEKNRDTQVGLIAQEVQKTIPEVVQTDNSTGMLSVNYTALVPVLIKSVQQQEAVIREQQARIASLEHARGPILSSVFSGGTGGGLALGLLPLAFVAMRRKRNPSE